MHKSTDFVKTVAPASAGESTFPDAHFLPWCHSEAKPKNLRAAGKVQLSGMRTMSRNYVGNGGPSAAGFDRSVFRIIAAFP